MPPGQNMDDMLTIFKSGMWRLFYKFSNEARKRFFNEFLPRLHDTKYFFLTSNIYMWLTYFFNRTEVLGERDANSWYLVYLGTRPDARGKGYARKLVEYVTSQVPSPRFPRKTLFS